MKAAAVNPVEVFGSFYLNDSEFALSVRSVQEVVNPPRKLTPVPLAPAYLLGVFNLRGMIIPVVDLKKIIGFEDRETTLATQKVAIVDFDGVRVGLLFDRTGEVFRCRAEEVSEFGYVAGEASKAVVSGVIKREGGTRIIQLLSPRALVQLENVPQVGGDPKQKRATGLGRVHQGDRKQCISFSVGPLRCAFGIESIHEIIAVPPIQQSALTGGFCIGMITLRGDLVPLISLSAIFGFGSPKTGAIGEDKRVILLKVGGVKLGLLIDSVHSIITYYADELLSLPVLGKDKPKMFLGCISKPETGDVILLDHQQALSGPEIDVLTQGHSKIYQGSAQEAERAQESKKRGLRKSYILFKLGSLFAVRIDEIREIIDYPRELLSAPGLPKSVRGMLNLRGEMVAVVDTRAIYSMAPLQEDGASKVLILERDGAKLGLKVDSVENIMNLSDEDKLKVPETLYSHQHASMTHDIKEALMVDLGGQSKSTLMILNLGALLDRVRSVQAA